jgi:hypothetical protein
MALDTYANLQASIASWLNREDLAAQIPDFIALAEAKFDRELRVNAMVARDVTTATSDYVELPGDWLQIISAVITSPTNTYSALRYIGPEEYNDLRNDGLTGTSRMYTIINNNMLLLPAPQGSVTIEIVYYKKIPALSASVATNWLLQRSQDLYLYASLIQAEAYLQNDERIPLWAGAVERIIADMKMESERDRRPQGALMARRKTFG